MGMLDREIQVVNGKKTLIRKADRTGIGRDKAHRAQKGGDFYRERRLPRETGGKGGIMRGLGASVGSYL